MADRKQYLMRGWPGGNLADKTRGKALRDMQPGSAPARPIGVPPPLPHSSRYDDAFPWPPGGTPGAAATSGPSCVKPKNWWLGALPPTSIRKISKAFFATYNAGVAEHQITTFQVDSGDTLVAFAHHYYATTPGAGSRRELLQPHEFQGLVNLLFRVDGAAPYTMGLDDGGTARSGEPFLSDKPFEHLEEIPLVVTGKSILDFSYEVVVAPGFTVNDIGFVLRGFQIDTGTLHKIWEECGV